MRKLEETNMVFCLSMTLTLMLSVGGMHKLQWWTASTAIDIIVVGTVISVALTIWAWFQD